MTKLEIRIEINLARVLLAIALIISLFR